MSRSRSLKRDAQSLGRKTPKRPLSGKSVLIVTEGEKTEPNYLKKLRDRLKLTAVDVEVVHPEGTDPITLTDEAIKRRTDRVKDVREGRAAIPYDEVWVVFDLEKIHGERRRLARQAIQKGKNAGIKFAVSDPCFEYWLLLHEKYTTQPFANCAEVERRLKKKWEGYSKGATPSSDFLEKISKAVANAENCRKHHKDSGGDGNPSTDMDFLARVLNEQSRPLLQFEF